MLERKVYPFRLWNGDDVYRMRCAELSISIIDFITQKHHLPDGRTFVLAIKVAILERLVQMEPIKRVLLDFKQYNLTAVLENQVWNEPAYTWLLFQYLVFFSQKDRGAFNDATFHEMFAEA